MSHSEALAAWRARNGLSQAAAARQLGDHLSPPGDGVAQGTWGAWETGAKAPDLSHAFGIEKMTGGEIPAAGWTRVRRKQRKQVRAKKPEPSPNDDSGTLHAVDGDEHKAAS